MKLEDILGKEFIFEKPEELSSCAICGLSNYNQLSLYLYKSYSGKYSIGCVCDNHRYATFMGGYILCANIDEKDLPLIRKSNTLHCLRNTVNEVIRRGISEKEIQNIISECYIKDIIE